MGWKCDHMPCCCKPPRKCCPICGKPYLPKKKCPPAQDCNPDLEPPTEDCRETAVCEDIPPCENPPLAECADESQPVQAPAQEADFEADYCDVPWLEQPPEPAPPEEAIFQTEQAQAAASLDQALLEEEADQAFDLSQPVSPQDPLFAEPLGDLTDELPKSPH